jgi:ferredoxin
MGYYITDKCIGCGACLKICPTGSISGEKKKQHVVNEEICIDCGACGRICPKNAVTDRFGLATLRVKKSLWEKPVFRLDACMACGMCMDACPVGCIAMSASVPKDPNAYPLLKDPSLCIACGFCKNDCPVDAITMDLYIETIESS